MPSAIVVEGISKRYNVVALGSQPRYRLLRESLGQLFGRLSRSAKQTQRTEFWALQDITFDVEEGEVLGVIGRNGAGKSTLLKILSRITLPTVGRAVIFGRVGSLLEVGTGFHHELTGRENIFFSGVLLGMHRSEVAAKTAAILDFAEIGDFLDTPVKFYSSGMVVRLAFSVAAFLLPEIVLLDEVLAVGDVKFQRKCTERIREISRSGRTVLLVSHNMDSIRQFCDRALYLSSGRLLMHGSSDEVARTYLASTGPTNSGGDSLAGFRLHNMSPIVENIHCWDGRRRMGGETFAPESPLLIEIDYNLKSIVGPVRFEIGVESENGNPLFGIESPPCGVEPSDGHGRLTCHVPKLSLVPGRYYLTLNCMHGQRKVDSLHRAATFTVGDLGEGSAWKFRPFFGHFLVGADWSFTANECRSGVSVSETQQSQQEPNSFQAAKG